MANESTSENLLTLAEFQDLLSCVGLQTSSIPHFSELHDVSQVGTAYSVAFRALLQKIQRLEQENSWYKQRAETPMNFQPSCYQFGSRGQPAQVSPFEFSPQSPIQATTPKCSLSIPSALVSPQIESVQSKTVDFESKLRLLESTVKQKEAQLALKNSYIDFLEASNVKSRENSIKNSESSEICELEPNLRQPLKSTAVEKSKKPLKTQRKLRLKLTKQTGDEKHRSKLKNSKTEVGLAIKFKNKHVGGHLAKKQETSVDPAHAEPDMYILKRQYKSLVTTGSETSTYKRSKKHFSADFMQKCQFASHPKSQRFSIKH